MVHHTMPASSSSAARASSRIRTMKRLSWWVGCAAIVGMLFACSSKPPRPDAPGPSMPPPAGLPALPPVADWPGDTAPLPPVVLRGRSQWIPVRWAELPGVGEDALHEAWNAWMRSCERPGRIWAALCAEVRQLSIATPEERRTWMMARLQPYRIAPLPGQPATEGLLTSYYEPMFDAARQPSAAFPVPLYQPPPSLAQRRPWYTRQEMETLPQAQAELAGREIAWLADPVDALVLQIQGSGRLRLTEPDGSQRLVRVAYAGTNEQPYKSVGRWLLDQGAIRDATWPGIKAWTLQNPDRVRDMLWSNPRMTFFREEPLPEFDAAFGPRGAQGVALTPGRSIAVDPQSIPYGTPVWLASSGPVANLARLVLAQDTGSAIVGAVRADYFAGWGPQAGEIAGRLKQPLRMWALWPR
ncbi:murein transglycosylase A [Pseudorhodoferax sp.]|uniref:murein transglycosylase A n=1 Tax=Pseudorhodoferax sp. TaxID=1993553 RepID=UPI0039E21605